MLNGLEQRNAKEEVLHVLEVRCKGPHLRPVGLHEAPSRPSVRGFLLNATNLAHHYGVVAKSFDAPGLAPGQRRLIMMVQQRPIGLSKWLGALCRLLALPWSPLAVGIATIPDALLAIIQRQAQRRRRSGRGLHERSQGGLCLGLPQEVRLGGISSAANGLHRNDP